MKQTKNELGIEKYGFKFEKLTAGEKAHITKVYNNQPNRGSKKPTETTIETTIQEAIELNKELKRKLKKIEDYFNN